jgi:two-component system phosphate regulon response regulator PhoB
MDPRPHILVVDDQRDIREPLGRYLEKHGLRVSSAASAGEARDLLKRSAVDLVILDIMMPGEDGLSLCRHLREGANMPVILLTAMAEDADRIVGLEVGADDYVVKPFSPSELIARLRAVMRRAKPASAEEVLHFSDLAMDLAAHRVTRNGKPVHLGPTEFRLLRFLMQHPGRVFSREQLLDQVWGHDVYVEPRTVDVHIRRLRKALNENETADLVRTVRSAGYSLDMAGADAA